MLMVRLYEQAAHWSYFNAKPSFGQTVENPPSGDHLVRATSGDSAFEGHKLKALRCPLWKSKLLPWRSYNVTAAIDKPKMVECDLLFKGVF